MQPQLPSALLLERRTFWSRSECTRDTSSCPSLVEYLS